MKKFLTVQDMALVAVFTAIIAVCSFIQIGIGPVPFTLPPVGVFVAAGVLGTKRGTLSVIVYILLGAIGIPVFAGSGGVGVIAGPTGGYIIGFVLTALIIGLITQLIKTESATLGMLISVVAMILGDVACFVIGTIQFMIVSGTNLAVTLGYCVTPFIIPDLAKIVVATIVVNRVKKYLKFIG